MSAITSTPIDTEAKNAPAPGRLFFLALSAGRVLSANLDGSDLKIIIDEGRKLPDGLALDVVAGHMYWTNMGDPQRNDGSIMRSDLNGKNMITIVPPGGTFTPKQLQLEKRSRKLYWSDREGMRVMRANLDGTKIETLVDASLGDSRPGSDPRKWCVGIAVDTDGGKFYWTQKGGHHAGAGRIFRANIQCPLGQSAKSRSDIELLYDNLPEPIDLDIDPDSRTLYWTDRGDPPRGNTVNRAALDRNDEKRKEPEVLFTHLMEGIGLALDLKGGRMFITDFGGSVYSANLDGSNRRTLLFAEGNLTGIAYAEAPSADKPSQAIGVPEETNMEDNMLVKSSFSATNHAPIGDLEIDPGNGTQQPGFEAIPAQRMSDHGMKRTYFPGITDIIDVTDPAAIRTISNDSRFDRDFIEHGPVRNVQRLRKMLRIFSLNGRVFQPFLPRTNPSRAAAQDELWSRLNVKAAEVKLGPAELEPLAEWVRGIGTAEKLDLLVQQSIGRLFVKTFTATEQSVAAARLILEAASSSNVLRMLGWRTSGRLERAKTLLASMVNGDLTGVIAMITARQLIVDGLHKMRQLAADPALRSSITTDAAVDECLFTIASTIRQAKTSGEVGGCPFRKGSLFILELGSASKGAANRDLLFLSQSWSRCPAEKWVPALLQGVWTRVLATLNESKKPRGPR